MNIDTILKIGYHPRFSGSTLIGSDMMKCAICEVGTNILFGIEKDYPKNPDMMVCGKCMDVIVINLNKKG